MGKFKQFLKRRAILWLMLLAGAYCGGLALWNLSNTLLFAHESVVLPATVLDVRQRPFESWTEALTYGNIPWQGEIAYRPKIRFSMPNGMRIPPMTAPDWDNADYTCGEQVEVIVLPHDPNSAHVYKWKFIWGADCMLLGLGLLLLVPSWLILFPRRKRGTAKPKQASRVQTTPAQHPKTQREEKPFTLQNEIEAPTQPKKTRAPRKKKEADPAAPKKPRAQRAKKATDGAAPKKPRTPRKKKTEG